MTHPVQNFPQNKERNQEKYRARKQFYEKNHLFLTPREEWYRLNWRRVGWPSFA